MRAVPAGTMTLDACNAFTTSVGVKPSAASKRRVEIDDDLTLLAAERRRRRQARDGEQPDPDEVQAVVEDLLLGHVLD